jgi:hypothetical protein
MPVVRIVATDENTHSSSGIFYIMGDFSKKFSVM